MPLLNLSKCRCSLALIVFCSFHVTASADPAWWTARGVINPSLPAEDYRILNLGQLKQMAAKGRDELNANMSGGAGASIDALVNGWSTTSTASDFSKCNVGQLKAVGKLFWDRLIASGWVVSSYPWTATTADDSDYAIANLGQLKNVFNFSNDLDGDGLPTEWEMSFGLNPADSSDADTLDPDGITYLANFQNGTSPTAARPVITLIAPAGAQLVP